jgi:hypothetical protein
LATLKAQIAGGPTCIATVIPCAAHGQPALVLMRCQGPCNQCGAVTLCPEPHQVATPATPEIDPRLRAAIADIPAGVVHELVVLVRNPAVAERVMEILAAQGGAGVTPAVMTELRNIVGAAEEPWPPR